MTTKNRKVCFTGPTRLKLAEEILRNAGCNLVMGKNQDDFRTYKYERREIVDLIGDCAVVFPSGRDVIGGDILDSCENLQAVVKSSIGIETVDVDAATDLGILCCNSPTPENFMGVAEATVGLMVTLFKRLKFNEDVLRKGGWKEPQNRGTLMIGRTVGIIGVGRIGRAVAQRAPAFGMRVVYASRSAVDLPGAEATSLDRVLNTSDVVSLHVPLTDETQHLIDKRALARMKRSAYLINTSRGPVVDEEALAWALKQHLLAGAALDVYEHEPTINPDLLKLENVLLVPHLASGTTETRTAMADLAAENVLAVLAGRQPISPVARS